MQGLRIHGDDRVNLASLVSQAHQLGNIFRCVRGRGCGQIQVFEELIPAAALRPHPGTLGVPDRSDSKMGILASKACRIRTFFVLRASGGGAWAPLTHGPKARRMNSDSGRRIPRNPIRRSYTINLSVSPTGRPVVGAHRACSAAKRQHTKTDRPGCGARRAAAYRMGHGESKEKTRNAENVRQDWCPQHFSSAVADCIAIKIHCT